MAESVVQFLLNELSQVLREEINLQRGVKREIKLIKAELGSINAFLRVADVKEEKDPGLAEWVKQVRDVAFDIEDILDAFSICFVHHDGDQDRRPRFKCLNKIASSYKKWKINRQTGSELQSIKTTVKEIYERHQRYPALLESGSSSRITNMEAVNQVRWNALLQDESQLVGTEEPKHELIDWLMQGDSNLTVLAIWGMGGLGKTTLVKQIYSSDKVNARFKSKALVIVSQTLKQEELFREVIQQLVKCQLETMAMAKDPQSLKKKEQLREMIRQIDSMNSYRLKQTTKDLLEDKKYLIVFDDVWKAQDWVQLRVAMPRNNHGTRVIITTRISEVGKYSTTEYQGMSYPMKVLSDSDSWTLFCKKTFQAESCPPNLKDTSEKIIRKCGGVPLAISTISGLLATKGVESVGVWKMILDSLSVELQENSHLQMMQRIFSLSFHDLPYNLKSCFLYLSIFPEDYLIERTRLVRLWIAEGFVQEKDGRTLEEVAESYFYELLNRSLIQAATTTYDGRVKSCRIHDFLREAILSKSKDENFVQVLSKDNVTKFPEEARRLSILNLSEVYTFKSSLLTKLRSLFLFGLGISLKMSELLSGGFKLLKVLDLQGAPLDTCPEQVFTLFLLRYLSFRNTRLSMLNTSIRNLHSLETLDLRRTHVTELPSEIYKLHKLRNLLIYNNILGGWDSVKFEKTGGLIQMVTCLRSGLKASAKIGGLVSLHKLCYIDATEEDDLITELGKLVQLRRLCLGNVMGHHGVALCGSISKMQCLSSLSLRWSESETIDLQGLSSPPLLKRLHLSGRLVELPSWLSSLQYLEVLHLMYSDLKEDPLKSLHSFPCLIDLQLDHAFTGEVMFIPPGGCFPSLKFLDISGSSKLLIFPNAIPSLEYVFVGAEGKAYDGREGYVEDSFMRRWLTEEEWHGYTEKEFPHIVKPRA